MRTRFLTIVLVLISTITACSKNFPSATTVFQGYEPSLSPAIGTPTVSRPTASPSPELAESPSSTAPPETLSLLTIRPDNGQQITLLANLQGSTSGRINNATWHPNGKTLLVENSFGLSLLDAASWETIWSIPGGYAQLVFAPDGSQLLAFDGAGQIILLDAASGERLSSHEVASEGRSTITGDGHFLAMTQGGDITLLDWKTGLVVQSLSSNINSGPILDMAFSADGQWVVAGSDNGDLQVWNAETGERTLNRPAVVPSPFYQCDVRGAIAGESTGILLVVCSYPSDNGQAIDYQVEVYSANANPAGSTIVIHDLEGQGYFNFAVNSDRSLLAAAVENTIEIWSLPNGSRIRSLADVAGEQMAFNPAESRLLAVWSDRAIETWDINSGRKVSEWGTSSPDSPPTHLAFSAIPGSRVLAIARADNSVQLWDTATGHLTASWQAEPSENITSMAFNPDGSFLAVSTHSGSILIFDIRLALSEQFELDAGFPIAQIAFSSDSTWLYAIGDSTSVHIWSMATKSEIAEWSAGSEYLSILAVRGSTLAVGSVYGILTIWNTSDSLEPDTISLNRLSGTPILEVSRDETQLIVMRGFDIEVWEMANWQNIHSWQVSHTPSLAYSPDGCTLAVGEGFSLHFMDVSRANYYKTFDETINLTSNLAFSADGLLLAAGYANGEVHLWGMRGALESPVVQVPQEKCTSFGPSPTATTVFTTTPALTSTFAPHFTPTFTSTTIPFTRTLYLTNPFMQGDDITILQQRLFELGYTEVGTPDGIFGAMTDASVRHFQEMNDLEVDGYVGSKTWQMLFSQDAV